MKKALKPSEKSVQAFEQWQATMMDDDYRQIIHEGKLNRGEIATGCAFAKSVLLQNPNVKHLLKKLEDRLRQEKILPDLSDAAEETAGQANQYDKNASKDARDAKRVSELELQVLSLEARLRCFEELSEVIKQQGGLDI